MSMLILRAALDVRRRCPHSVAADNGPRSRRRRGHPEPLQKTHRQQPLVAAERGGVARKSIVVATLIAFALGAAATIASRGNQVPASAQLQGLEQVWELSEIDKATGDSLAILLSPCAADGFCDDICRNKGFTLGCSYESEGQSQRNSCFCKTNPPPS